MAPVSALPRPAAREQVRYLRQLFVDPQPVLDEVAERYGPVCGFGFGPLRMAVVGEPNALRDLFAAPTESFRWGHRFNVIGLVAGQGSMIVSDGPDHRRRRSSVQGAFGIRRLNSWIPMIASCTDAAIDRLGSTPGVVDMYPVGVRIIIEVVTRALFGERLGARAEEIGVLFKRPQAYLESSAVRQLPHPFPFGRREAVRADRRALDAIIDDEIAERRAHPSDDRLDVLNVLVQDGSLSDAEIRDQVVTLIGAGYNTTVATLAWTLWRATLEPGLWDRLGAEADAHFDGVSLDGLDLAGRVVRETLRLHPAGALSPRQAAVDVEVGGYRIPKGTMVLWSPHLAGRDEKAWADPLRFDPDRFVGLTPEQQALADAAWVPFGKGPRACIGFALAQMELTLITSRLAQRLVLEPTATEPPRPVGMVVNRPSGGAPMHVRLRERHTPLPD